MNFLTVALKMLSNPKVQKILLIIIVLVIVVWMLNRGSAKFNHWYRTTLAPVKGDNVNAPISSQRKGILEDLALDTYNAIYGGFVTMITIDDLLINLNSLPDNELKYVATYYEKMLSDNSLYYDVDWESLPFIDSDEILMSKLKSMNIY